MIVVTRLNGNSFAINPDLLIRIEETPDTVLTLVDSTKLVVAETLAEVIDRIVAFRGRIIAQAQTLDTVVERPEPKPALTATPEPAKRVAPAVPLHLHRRS